jgi:hypothetical protein
MKQQQNRINIQKEQQQKKHQQLKSKQINRKKIFVVVKRFVKQTNII